MSLEALLRKTATAGGRELHLAKSRRIRIVTADGDRELQGPEVTSQLIQQFIAPVVPAAAKDALAHGRAEWTLRHRRARSHPRGRGAGVRVVLSGA